MINACLWDVPALEKHLRLLVQLLNGLRRKKLGGQSSTLSGWFSSHSAHRGSTFKKSAAIFRSMWIFRHPHGSEKTCSPSTNLTFTGIELDTIRCESPLLEDELLWCQHWIAAFLRRKKETLKELKSLIGVLNFACSVVVPGRSFFKTSNWFD